MSFFRNLLGYISQVVVFADAKVKELLLASSNINPDGTRDITYDEAQGSNVSWSEIDTAIDGSTDIEYFNELKYFRRGTVPANFLQGCSNLKEITLPGDFTDWNNNHGKNAFDGTGIKKLDLSSFTNLHTDASHELFGTMLSLEEVWIPNLTAITGKVFYTGTSIGQPNVTKVVLRNAEQLFDITLNSAGYTSGAFVPWCGKNASFYDVEGNLIDTIYVPNSKTSIPDYAFYYIKGIDTIVIHSGCTSCGRFAFSGLPSTTTIVGADYLTNVGYKAFQYCQVSGINNIPASVTSIDAEAYIGSSITRIESTSLQSVGTAAFRGSSITSIKANNLVTLGELSTIGASFNNCTSLKDIQMNAITTVPYGSFSGATSLESVEMKLVTTLTGPCFYGASELTTVDMPNLTSIGSECFSGCSKLDSEDATKFNIDIANAAFIDSRAFFGCSKVRCPSVFGTNLTALGSSSFKNCLPPITSTYVTLESTSVVTLNSYNTVYGSPFPSDVTTIYVPANLVSSYEAAPGWSTLSGIQFDSIANRPS